MIVPPCGQDVRVEHRSDRQRMKLGMPVRLGCPAWTNAVARVMTAFLAAVMGGVPHAEAPVAVKNEARIAARDRDAGGGDQAQCQGSARMEACNHLAQGRSSSTYLVCRTEAPTDVVSAKRIGNRSPEDEE